LKAAGLKVAEVDGWQERGHGDVGTVQGVICHHTAGPKSGNMPSLGTVRDGRPDLPGPLSQLGLGRDGTFYIIAAGKCSHAGEGEWRSIKTGNMSFIGIEAENTGSPNDFPWPSVQIDAYQRGVAAILKHINQSSDFCCGHKEYAHPLGRKKDPTFDMDAFRFAVASLMQPGAAAPVLIPAVEHTNDVIIARRTLRRGAEGALVRTLQVRLGVTPQNGTFGPKTEAAVREFQRENGMVADGIVGPKTWAAFDKAKAR
jgi:hypothetical protein